MPRKRSPILIPEQVVQPLRQHVEETGKPLLRAPERTDRCVLEAWGDGSGGYDLTSSTGRGAWYFVKDIVECQIERDGEMETVRLASRMIGGGPGSSYRCVYVRSRLHLSLLQHRLDEEGRGVRVSVRR